MELIVESNSYSLWYSKYIACYIQLAFMKMWGCYLEMNSYIEVNRKGMVHLRDFCETNAKNYFGDGASGICYYEKLMEDLDKIILVMNGKKEFVKFRFFL